MRQKRHTRLKQVTVINVNKSENKNDLLREGNLVRILLTGGGTAGHINPALAMADYIKEKEEDTKVLFVGTEEGMEKTLVPKSGYDIEYIKVHGFERKISVSNIKNVFEILSSVRKTKKIIKRFKPDIAIGTGGYVTGPVLYAAAKMKIPTLAHESNAYPGITIRILAKYVDVTALAFSAAKPYIKNAKEVVVTGNPLRPELFKTCKAAAREKLSLDNRRVILIFGGSLGATRFNEAAVSFISALHDIDKYQIIMSAGKNNHYEKVMNMFSRSGIDLNEHKNIRVFEYIYDMASALSACDLIIGRSGSSVAEMTALKKPAILIPSPNVAGNHQEYNARAMEKAGAAKVILERDLSARSLYDAVDEIFKNENVYEEMAKSAENIGIKDATARLYEIAKRITAKQKL